MKRRIRTEITEGAKKHIASHNVRAGEVLTIFELGLFREKVRGMN